MNETEKYEPTEEETKSQTDFFSKSEDEKTKVVEQDFLRATEDHRRRDMSDQIETEKVLMEERKSLDFEELKRGDVFIFETVKGIKFESGEYLSRLEERKKSLPYADDTWDRIEELLRIAEPLLEEANKRPFGDGERQLIFDRIRDTISMYPDLFEDQDVSGKYRVEIVGKRKLRVRGGEKEDCLLVKIDSDSRRGGDLTARVAKKDFSLENVSESLGRIYFENVKQGKDPYAGGMSIPRIGRLYK